MYLTTLLNKQDVTQGQFLGEFNTFRFFFSEIGCHTKVKESVYPTINLYQVGD